MATKPRTRKPKAAAAPAVVETPAVETPIAALTPTLQAPPAGGKNVSPSEGTISVYAGALLIAAALFPRTLRQWALLGLGAGFLYRGRTRHCGVYSAFGIDTNK